LCIAILRISNTWARPRRDPGADSDLARKPAGSLVFADPKMTTLENPNGRPDGSSNTVHDRAIFECTQRKPPRQAIFRDPEGGQPEADNDEKAAISGPFSG
jgi:hypothetical protein